MVKTTGLGQGVGALFGNSDDDDRYFECDINLISPNKYQPRIVFNDEALGELAESIKENGIIQPLIVSRSSANSYELIAGERRLRASKLAGLKTVPVVVQDINGEGTLLEMALIENIQRTDLNPLEEAEAFKKLIDHFGYTQEETANKVGKKRSTITNTLRLLLLPDFLKKDLLMGSLTEGHARTLLRIVDDPVSLKDIRNQIIQKQLSVRQTEYLIRNLSKSNSLRKVNKGIEKETEGIPNSYRKALENQLTNKFNSKVIIHQSGSRGKIEIEYYSLDDLERLVGIVTDDIQMN